jgi:hypothetical protein
VKPNCVPRKTRNLFGALVVLAWAAVLLALARKNTGRAPRFVLSVLAVQVALNAVYDIRILFLVHGRSDAETMAPLFLLPAWLWAASLDPCGSVRRPFLHHDPVVHTTSAERVTVLRRL